MTNREAHEDAAGMGLDDAFFKFNKIDPDAECIEDEEEQDDCKTKQLDGLFITLEGPDCAGKTTHMANIKNWLEVSQGQEVLTCREPGGTYIGEQLRTLLKTVDGENQASEIAELLMFSAARRQLLDKVILPFKKNEGTVLCDRFLDSTTAYQGYGRKIDLDIIYAAHGVAVGNNYPDLTILLDVSPKERLIRKTMREGGDIEQCNFENETVGFHNDVRNGYLQIAQHYPSRFIVIESDREQEVTWVRIRTQLERYFNPDENVLVMDGEVHYV